MATLLTKPVTRKTAATQYEKSALRNLIISLEPAGRDAARVAVRLSGTRQTYRIGANSIYVLAVQQHMNRIEKRAKELHKYEKLPMRTARARARKELDKELR